MEKLTPLISINEPWEHRKRKRTDTTPFPSNTCRVFSRRKQCWRVFISGLWQVVITSAFCGALVGLFVYYSRRELLTAFDLRVYNAVNIGLTLFLGAQIGSAFKGFARNIRWQLLSTKYFDLKQFEKIMGCESMMTSAQLLWSGRNKGHKLPSQVQWYCAVSLILNLGMQIILALLGLIVAPGASDTYVDVSQKGQVRITDFSKVQISPGDGLVVLLPSDDSPEMLSNVYGRVGELTLAICYDPTDAQLAKGGEVFMGNLTAFYGRPDEFWNDEPPGPDDLQSLIFLLDYAVDVDQGSSVIASWRGVSSDTNCELPKRSHFVTESVLLIDQGDGTSRSVLWSGPRSRNITTWATHDEVDCGSRCTNVKVLVPISDSDSTDETYHMYSCNSTVSEIWRFSPQADETYRNAPEKQIPDVVAKIFAGAIGRGKRSSDTDAIFYCQHPNSSKYGRVDQNSSSEEVELLVSGFSTRSIGAMDERGDRIQMEGYPPRTLQNLPVKWFLVILMLAGLPVAQLLLAIIITILSARAVIKDTSFIAAAQLLKPALDELGSQGSILTGDEIADHLGNIKLCYGVREIGGSGEYFVDMIKQAERIEHQQGTVWWPGRKMPQGLYDGPEMRQSDDLSRRSSNW